MRRFDTVICWESQNLRESVIDLPHLIELTVGEDITSYGCGNSGADLFACMKCYERLTRFEKAKKNVESIKGSGKLNDKELINVWSLWKMSHMPPNKLQQQSEFQPQNL